MELLILGGVMIVLGRWLMGVEIRREHQILRLVEPPPLREIPRRVPLDESDPASFERWLTSSGEQTFTEFCHFEWTRRPLAPAPDLRSPLGHPLVIPEGSKLAVPTTYRGEPLTEEEVEIICQGGIPERFKKPTGPPNIEVPG